jgi:hypothetical protein
MPTATSTRRPTSTPVYAALGELFSAECSNGNPARIWSNDSFNGPCKRFAFDEPHGHVVIFVPEGCDVNSLRGEVLAPATGELTRFDIGDGTYGYRLVLPSKVYLKGIEQAFEFAGLTPFRLAKVQRTKIGFGHIDAITGKVSKGQAIGEVIPFQFSPGSPIHLKVAYQVQVLYDNVEYMFSPTLFAQEGLPWICAPDSPYDCVAEPRDCP